MLLFVLIRAGVRNLSGTKYPIQDQTVYALPISCVTMKMEIMAVGAYLHPCVPTVSVIFLFLIDIFQHSLIAIRG